ncbi:D-Ala-D-Ala carboxypeptidase family metallohydrolase [Lysobacter antibioticus]|uniref:Peptidase M15 family protein n=1 Tax=Lysobacter antibioticus TaxID=84531 RepID=A0A0S2F7J4_LYSAN|nr:D-Ala-D-Ala carboxypeptidase family metallohydrolase [Lysobacter antibioticus]ALN79510.1 peptidase M15 family protein [Lysobacter antibioticus]
MAQLIFNDIGANLREGLAFGTQQRVQREGEQRRNRLAELSSQAYSTGPDQQQNLLGQMAAVSPEAAAQQSQQFESQDDRRNKTLTNMARTLVGLPPQARAGMYQRMLPALQQFGLSDLPPTYDAQSAPIIDKTAQALAQAAMGAQGQPTGFRELDMIAQAAGYAPGTPEYQQAAQVRLGLRGRAATGGFGFEEIVGADGRTRLGRTNPRTGTLEVYDEATGDFTPLGGSGQLNPGTAPPQMAPVQAPSASNLGSPITMPNDLSTTFASLGQQFPGTQITSTLRTPERNAQVGGVPNSQHLRGTAADFTVPPEQRQAFIQAARQQGFEAIDEGDHVHLELPSGARAPAVRADLGVSRSPEEQAALTTAAQEQAKINAEIGAYDRMTGLEAERAAAVEGAKAGAKTQAEVSAQQGVRTRDAGQVLSLLAEAEKLLPRATGSGGGALLDTIAGAGGYATDGAKATAQLRTIAGQLVSKMPRMEGPQSNADVKMYQDMAGDLANPATPREQRLAALQTIRKLSQKYAAPQRSQPPRGPTASAPAAGGVDDLLSKYGIR